MDIVVDAFQRGQFARSQSDFNEAIIHYTRALEVFHSVVGSGYDPAFWATILYARAESYLLRKRYNLVVSDIKQALNACPFPIFDLEQARLWLEYGSRSDTPPTVTVWCCYGAMHFAKGDSNLQSEIYSVKALAYYNIGDETRCERDAKEGKLLNIKPTWQTGMNVKINGMEMFRSKQYDEATRHLQLAEIFLRPLDPDKVQSVKKDWYECSKYLITAAWRGTMYAKAIQAGKKWRQMRPIKSEDEAFEWKEKGNEMIRQNKFDMAIDCYTLSIQYTAVDGAQLLGTLHSNRSHAYFKKKQFKKAKEDAEKCLKYRPNWSKSFYRLGSALMELQMNERAMEILKDGLSMRQACDDKYDEEYDIFKKIMSLAFKSEGNCAATCLTGCKF